MRVHGRRTRRRPRATLARARADDRIAAAAFTGSVVAGREDAWSDIDLGFGISDGVELEPVIASWTDLLETEFGAFHHWDLPFGSTMFRVFLLSSGLGIDLAFTPHAEFASYGPGFRSVFGTHRERELPDAALRAAAEALLNEIRELDAPLADRLAQLFGESPSSRNAT